MRIQNKKHEIYKVNGEKEYLYGLCCGSLVISVRKLSESVSIWCHYTGKTDLKLDSPGFLTLIT